jgi:hypothetical protein
VVEVSDFYSNDDIDFTNISIGQSNLEREMNKSYINNDECRIITDIIVDEKVYPR